MEAYTRRTQRWRGTRRRRAHGGGRAHDAADGGAHGGGGAHGDGGVHGGGGAPQCFLESDPRTVDDIVQYLEHASQHPTGCHWVDNLILPTIIIHQFLRAGKEGDWILQKLCFERMLPYFFAPGHFHYARYITQHLPEQNKD